MNLCCTTFIISGDLSELKPAFYFSNGCLTWQPHNGPPVAKDIIMNRRSDARKVALQMLYLVDQNSEQDLTWIRTKIEQDLDNPPLADFAWNLFSSVRENQSSIDEQIIGVAKNWKLHRMAITDRNLLRLGVCEIQHLKSPVPVVLNECIELAKEFGTENSASFVNGLLDKISSAVDQPNA